MEEWKRTLEPYAKKMAEIVGEIRSLEDDKLDKFIDACKWPSQTNCWWATKMIADSFVGDARAERERRHRIAS